MNNYSSYSNHLPARALLYVLFITLLIAIISGSLISLAHIKNNQINEYLLQLQLIRNVDSGIALLKASEEITIPTTDLDLFSNQQDSITYEKKDWGLLKVGLVTAFKSKRFGSRQLQKAVLLGDTLQKEQKAALYVQDDNKPLAVVGKNIIKGDAYLSNTGIKQGYVGGLGFNGSIPLEGTLKRSSRSLPLTHEERLSSLLLNIYSGTTTQPFVDSLYQSFFDDTYHLTGSTIYLDKTILKGNIVVQADSIIYVSSNSKLQDVLLFAPYIIFEKEFEGRCQVFASEYIELQENVHLAYPSVLCLLQSVNSTENSKIELKDHSSIEGLLLYHQFAAIDKQLMIPKTVRINGQVFVDATLQLEGVVYGNITCRGFRVKTPSSIYDNHLMDATIDYTKLQKDYLSPCFLQTNTGNRVINQVY